ncbi:MAG TPA: hypothetical protein PKV29_03825, partial [Trichococcus flocculiformis]|nr:hypothetical protein [Trichococcus flocculiformis]
GVKGFVLLRIFGDGGEMVKTGNHISSNLRSKDTYNEYTGERLSEVTILLSCANNQKPPKFIRTWREMYEV